MFQIFFSENMSRPGSPSPTPGLGLMLPPLSSPPGRGGLMPPRPPSNLIVPTAGSLRKY